MATIDRTLRELARKESRGFGVRGTWSGGQPKYVNYNLEQLTEEGYRKNSIVSACISMVGTTIPEAKLRVYTETSQGDKEINDHWLTKLLRRPNPFMSAFELWEWTATYLNTGGASYWELVRAGLNPNSEILEIYPLRPDRMKIIPDVENYISAYEYNVNGNVIHYQPWEILQVKFPDPLDEFYGLSPIKRVSRELGIDNEATDFTATFLENMAVPYGLLTSEQYLQEPDAERMRLKWWQWLKGKNKGKPAVLGQGTQYQQLGMNFKDMEFEQLRSFTETRICGAFGVDPVLLPSWVGIKYGGKYSNYSEAKRHLWDETLIPTLRRIEHKITSQLLKDENVFARFDVSEVQALQENETEKVNRINSIFVSGLITKNEGRLALGWDKVEGGDEFAKAEPTPQDPEPQDPEEKPKDDQEETDDNEKGFFFDRKKLVPTDFLSALHMIQDSMEKGFSEELQSFFTEQKKEVVAIFEGKKSEQMSFEDWEKYQQEVENTVTKWAGGLLKLATKNIKNILIAGGSIAAAFFKIPFNGTSPDVLAFIEQYIPKFVNGITTVTLNDLRSVMLAAQTEGWAMTKIRDEVRSKYNGYTKTRADVIAKTETIRSSNYGAKISYKAAGATEVEWLATQDPRCCDFCCQVMDGKIVGIDQSFAKLGDVLSYTDSQGKTHSMTIKYENIEAAPLHPRCRCTVIPV